jgi:glutamyl-tRNA synthetase
MQAEASALLTDDARTILASAHAKLVALANWDVPVLEAAIREADNERLADLVAPRLGITEKDKATLVRAMPELKARAHTLNELADGARFLFAKRPLEMQAEASSLLTDEARTILASAHAKLVALANWDGPVLEEAIREFAEGSGVKLGKLAQPLRAALTGRTTSPGIFDVLALLGREESLARIADQMEPKA